MWVSLLSLLIVALFVIGGVVVASWRRPELGPVDGNLRTCPDSPNCVCSYETDKQHGIEPLSGGEDSMEQLRQVLASKQGIVVIADEGDYIRAECTSRLMRYIDDIEFLNDAEAGVIHVRSASRVGHSDLGANRNRVEEIRRRLAEETVD
ncbi:MAG: DUF1499 domain-containing protein [Planctomycetaceae bacterium]|nr:DUF1499 domain-containing protein [Planctomycetaceae bacterium]